MSQSLRSMTAEQLATVLARRTQPGALRGLDYLAAPALKGRPARAMPAQAGGKAPSYRIHQDAANEKDAPSTMRHFNLVDVPRLAA